MVFVSGICRSMYRPGSPEGPEPFLRWLETEHKLAPATCKVLEARRVGDPDTVKLVFRGPEDAEECARVVNRQGKVGSRTLHFNDVCRTLGEEALRELFKGHGEVEYLELFRTGEDEGSKSKAGGRR